jgi:hypothetical protein
VGLQFSFIQMLSEQSIVSFMQSDAMIVYFSRQIYQLVQFIVVLAVIQLETICFYHFIAPLLRYL